MRNVGKALKLILPMEPFRLGAYLLLSLPGALLPAVMLYLQQRIVDGAASLSPERSLFFYIKPVLLLMGTYMLLKLFRLLALQYMEFGYFRYILLDLDDRIHEKSARVPLEYYDNAAYYQTVQRAKQASTFLVFTANLAVMSLLAAGSLLSVGGYLAAMHPLLLLFVAAVSIPVGVEKYLGAKGQASLAQDMAQVVRRKKYAFGLLAEAGSKKEIAHHGAGAYVADKYLKACEEADEREEQYGVQAGRRGLLCAGVKTLAHSLAVFMMVWLLVSGRITLGGFSVLLSSFALLSGTFSQLFDHGGEILKTGAMSEAFFALMDLEVRDGTEDLTLDKGREAVRLEGVSYRYPGSEAYALRDISLSIKTGEKIAIVGENGAGKTTLAKLLSGFLLPSEGRMELGGIPREQLREEGIFDWISAVYQEFGRYKLTLAQNVILGDTGAAEEGDCSENPAGKAGDRENIRMEEGCTPENVGAVGKKGTAPWGSGGKRIREALDWADLFLEEDPEQMLLGREFGGRELSGGQWQRLALARSYYRRRPVLFFDEPTAAIDPLEEAALYGKLEKLAAGRTLVLVTHRLGAVRQADRILLLEGGKIAEAGSFTQLMERKGRFYRIWNEQTKWYKERKE